MAEHNMKTPPDRSLLDDAQQAAFRADCEAGKTDVELADKWGLRERTATNWRLRLYGPRKKKNCPAT
jgi:hypothetical protein